MTPRIVVVSNPHEAGELAADSIATFVTQAELSGRDVVLGFATGSTPLPVYAELARREICLSYVRGFALDEYVGLPHGHPQSYASVIEREVVGPLGLDPARVLVPDGTADDLAAASDEFERAIQRAGGIDVQLLGIGSNGHLAFNEPGTPLDSLTHVIELTEQTRRDNSRFFDTLDDVPTHAITQGLGTISRARELVLLAFGEGKAAALAAALEGPISESLPASIIQQHPDVLVLVDEAAASLLSSRQDSREHPQTTHREPASRR